MDKKYCPQHTPSNLPCCDHDIEERILARVRCEFATNNDVGRLANELQKLKDSACSQASEAATIAAGMVLQQVNPTLSDLKQDIDNKKDFKVVIASANPENGTPLIDEPDFTTLYLTKNDFANDNNYWDEWLAIPGQSGEFSWEKIGLKPIDLSWVDQNFDNVNRQICQLQCSLGKFSKETAQAILDHAVRPLQDLGEYVKQHEINAQDQLDRVTGSEDGVYTPDNESNYIGGANNLKDADTKLDAAIKQTADNAQAQLDSVTGSNNGAYEPNAESNYISGAGNLKDADTKLDAAIKKAVDDAQGQLDSVTGSNNGAYEPKRDSNYIGDAINLKDADTKLDAAIKKAVDDAQGQLDGVTGATDGVYAPNTGSNYISSAGNLQEADNMLDTAVKQLENGVNEIKTLDTNYVNEFFDWVNGGSVGDQPTPPTETV